MNGLVSTWSTYQDQDATSSDFELPVKGKLSFKDRSAAIGREAALQKQLHEAAKDRQDLAKRYDVKDQKCNELRDKLKVTKAALSSRERELEMSQRMLQKLGAEKNQLRDDVAEHKVYVRKLEARLDDLKNAADISSRYQAAKQKAHELQHQLVSVTAELGASKEVAAQRQKEIEKLTRALDIHASELSQDAGGQDVPAKLLHSLAESREESLELAKQLASTKAEMNRIRQSAARLTERAETAELVRADAEVAAEQLRQRLEKLLSSSQEATKSRADMAQLLVNARSESDCYKSERDELAEVVLEMQEEIEQLRAATAAAQTNGELAAAAAADEAMHRLADTHAAANDARQQQLAREAQLSQRCTQLTEQSAQLEAAWQQQLHAAQQAAADKQQQIMVLESQLASRRQRELDLDHQVAELRARTEQLGEAVSSVEAAANRIKQLEQQVVRLEASLRVAAIERQQLEQRLQQAGDEAAAQQQDTQRTLDALRVQLATEEAAHRCALEDVAGLQQQLTGVVGQLDKTAAAKAQLQHNMLHQISSIKEKLQIAEHQSQQQLMAPGSPLFPARNRSSSNSHGSTHHKSSGRTSVGGDGDIAGPAAAAALATARSRPKGIAGAGKRGSRATSPSAAAGRAAMRPRSRAISAHSSATIGHNSAAARQLQLGQASHGDSSDAVAAAAAASRAVGEQLAADAAAKVAEFAARLQQQADTVGMHNYSMDRQDLDVPAGFGRRDKGRVGMFGRPASSLALNAGSGNAAAATGAALLRRSLDNSILLRSGSVYGCQGQQGVLAAQKGPEQAASWPNQRAQSPGELASPPESRFASSGGSGTGARGGRMSVGPGRPGSSTGQHQQQRQHSRGLADTIDNMSWLDILRADAGAVGPRLAASSPAKTQSHSAAAGATAGDGPFEQYSPHGSDLHSAAARGVGAGGDYQISSHTGGGSSSSRGGSAGGNPSAHAFTQKQQQEVQQRQRRQQERMHDAMHYSRPGSTSPDTHADSRNARMVGHPMADYIANSQPAEAADGSPQSAAAQARRSSLSWLQQPMEPYSPTLAAKGSAGSKQGDSVHSLQHRQPSAAAAGQRRDDLADPYSLPASAEQSAASLQGVGAMLGSYGGVFDISNGGAAAGSFVDTRDGKGGAWHQTPQQQQHDKMGGQQQVMVAGGVHRSPNRSAASTAAAAGEDPRLGPIAEVYSRATDLLHACGAWEVRFETESNTDDEQHGEHGRSRENSNSSIGEEERLQRPQECHQGRQQQHPPVQMNRPQAVGSPQHGSHCTLQADGSSDELYSHLQQQQGQQSRPESTRATLQELPSQSRQSGSLGMGDIHSPDSHSHSKGSENQHSHKVKCSTNATASRASSNLQLRQHQQVSSMDSRAAAATGCSSSSSGIDGRRLSDGSSSSSYDGQGHSGDPHRRQGLYLHHDHAGGAAAAVGRYRGDAALLSPPSTVKVDRVAARRSGARSVPMPELAGDASWQPQANANRLSTTSHQQQRQRQQFHSNKQLPSDPNLASWDGQDDSSNDAASLVPHHMQQQYSRGQSSVLARRSDGGVVASGRQPGGTGVQSRSIRQLSDRGAGEKAAMDALLAKLSAGEPTLQDLAELENML